MLYNSISIFPFSLGFHTVMSQFSKNILLWSRRKKAICNPPIFGLIGNHPLFKMLHLRSSKVFHFSESHFQRIKNQFRLKLWRRYFLLESNSHSTYFQCAEYGPAYTPFKSSNIAEIRWINFCQVHYVCQVGKANKIEPLWVASIQSPIVLPLSCYDRG